MVLMKKEKITISRERHEAASVTQTHDTPLRGPSFHPAAATDLVCRRPPAFFSRARHPPSCAQSPLSRAAPSLSLSSSSVKKKEQREEQIPLGKSIPHTRPFPNHHHTQLARPPNSIPQHFLPRDMAPIAGCLGSRTCHCCQLPKPTFRTSLR
jgi:hypothetical protein